MAVTDSAISATAFHLPLQGAYTSIEALLACRFAARELSLRKRKAALSQLAGPNKTHFRGRGMDFEEVRSYQAGDDIRHLDWRVTARLGGAYTKLFREERERPLLLFIDQRQPMFFGSRHCFKSVSACHLAALLAWAGLSDGDRIGGMVVTNDTSHDIRPRRSRHAVLNLIRELLRHHQALDRLSGLELDVTESFANALNELRRVAKPGSAIYLISDFAGYQHPRVQEQLYKLSRHCELTALHVEDPLERTLPPAGLYTVSDGQHQRVIDTGIAARQRAFRDDAVTRQQQLQRLLNQAGVPMLTISTAQAPLAELKKYFSVRR